MNRIRKDLWPWRLPNSVSHRIICGWICWGINLFTCNRSYVCLSLRVEDVTCSLHLYQDESHHAASARSTPVNPHKSLTRDSAASKCCHWTESASSLVNASHLLHHLNTQTSENICWYISSVDQKFGHKTCIKCMSTLHHGFWTGNCTKYRAVNWTTAILKFLYAQDKASVCRAPFFLWSKHSYTPRCA